MKLDQLHPSKYLAASDFPGPQIGVMAYINMEEMNDGVMKPILYFSNLPKGIVLNKTNAHSIGMIYGDETDAWAGQHIEVYQDHTLFQGEMKPCIRVRAPQQVPVQQAPVQPMQQTQPVQPVPQTQPVTPQAVQNAPRGFDPNVPAADTFPGDK